MEPEETYLKAVCKQLHGPQGEKKMFLQGLRSDIEIFLDQNPNAAYNDIEANFGNLKDLAQEFANSLEPQVIERFLRIKKRFFLFVGAIVIVTALIILGLRIADYVAWRHLANGYYVETIIVSPDSIILPEKPMESTDTILVYR